MDRFPSYIVAHDMAVEALDSFILGVSLSSDISENNVIVSGPIDVQ